MASKYTPLQDWLSKKAPEPVRLTISELEHEVGVTFPPYVHKYQWGNDRTQPLARAWLSAGYLVSQPVADKEVLAFRYDPKRSEELLSGSGSACHRRKKERRSDVPRPCAAEVEKYLAAWDEQDSYRLQEKALDKLFFDAYPSNTTIEDVLIKVTCLNALYSTNIFSPFTVAMHILKLNIDERLKVGDPSLVEDIALVTMGNAETKNFYSFATKYCSHHQPKQYAIWDSYVDEVLKYFRDVDGFAIFADADLKSQALFKDVLYKFASYYGISRYSLKDLDRYLWQLGKDKFPQKRYQKIAGTNTTQGEET